MAHMSSYLSTTSTYPQLSLHYLRVAVHFREQVTAKWVEDNALNYGVFRFLRRTHGGNGRMTLRLTPLCAPIIAVSIGRVDKA